MLNLTNAVNIANANWFITITDYLTICKPRVVLLMLITALVGMHLASPGLVPWQPLLWGTIGIGLAACSAAALNHLLDRHIDSKMLRTAQRPIAKGRITPIQAIVFAAILGSVAMLLLFNLVNATTAWLTFATLFGYAGFYTLVLKRATPQNIVIGGAAGAMPPLLGWSAISGDISPFSLLLVLIIFVWTPPHFWALAIYRADDYAHAKIPMLPNTHGIRFTKLCILLYSILLLPVTVLPYLVGMSGLLYLIFSLILDSTFIYRAFKLARSSDKLPAHKLFDFSIKYLLILFLALLADHYLILYI